MHDAGKPREIIITENNHKGNNIKTAITKDKNRQKTEQNREYIGYTHE